MSCPKRSQRLKKYEETLLDSGCLRITNCTSAPILGHIYCVFTLKHRSYCLKSCTKGFAGVTQEEDLCHTKPLPRGIGGRGCRRKPWNMLRNVSSAKGLPQISISQEGSSTLCPAHGRLPSGAWILQAPSPRQQEIRDICWLVQITSPNGLKLSHQPTSETQMLRNSSREILLHDTGSFEPSFQIMDSNLTIKLLENTVANQGSQTGTQPQIILREMDKPKLSTKSFSMGLRKDWMTPREDRQRSCHTSYGLTGPHHDDEQKRHLLP